MLAPTALAAALALVWIAILVQLHGEGAVRQVRLVDMRDATNLGWHLTQAFYGDVTLGCLTTFVAEASARDVQD